MNKVVAPKPGLILVDDDPLIAESLDFVLAEDFAVHTAESRSGAKILLQALKPVPSLALVDLGLPPTPHSPEEGFALITELLAFNRRMKILVLSGQSGRANIQHALTLGAVDFVPKPCDAELLKARLHHQLLILDAERPEHTGDHSFGELLIGDSPPMQTLRGLVKQFADTPFPVLIEGESGSGKELVAKSLHRESSHGAEPLLTINCAAFSVDLLEAQLFGHAKGAFTGADQARPGFFEDAGSGTLFLDEVGEMPAGPQVQFLRVLEDGEYFRLGETHPRRSRARIIAATNRDLREAVRTGAFRQDLFHRLSVLCISVPPLRSRGDDWATLLDFFQQQYSDSIRPFTLDDGARNVLADYAFPGNVRELRNIVIRLGAKYPGQTIGAAAASAELELQLPELGGLDEGGVDDETIEQRMRERGFRLDEEIVAVERRYIRVALKMSDGNLSKAARLLGVNRTTLYSKVARLGIPGGEA